MFEREMRKCFRLAGKGLGKVSPNPLVGCVVLDSNGKEIATGFHKRYGENHAERNALLKLSPEQTNGGTLIVNLEPCNHYGKTPPCSDLIIQYGLKRVVISNLDPNPKASGGIKKLKDAGIEVICGILKEEGEFLNRIFFTNITQRRPYIVTKTATTIDGKIATHNGDSKWITSERSRKLVKKLRKQHDAILTTSATVLADNPEMKHCTKIILDREGKLDFDKQIFKRGKILLVTTRNDYNAPKNITVIKGREIGGKLDLKDVFAQVYEHGVRSIFVEAGSILNGYLIKEGLVDEIIHFVAPKVLNDNSGISCFAGDSIDLIKFSKEFKLVEVKALQPDHYARYISNR